MSCRNTLNPRRLRRHGIILIQRSVQSGVRQYKRSFVT
ncbi:hypothetical protein ACHAXN_000179 [Cyclotella atomus]